MFIVMPFTIPSKLTSIETIFAIIKHEYLRSRASTCVSLSSPSSHLLAIYTLSRYSCLYLGSLHPRIFTINFISDHYTFCLKCKSKCEEHLFNLDGHQEEQFLALVYNYLQFSYFKGTKNILQVFL